jgi:hypothetical protein
LQVNPRWGWYIAADSSWWHAFSFLRLEHSTVVRGYTFILICAYLLVVALTLAAAVCVWAAHGLRANDFKSTWCAHSALPAPYACVVSICVVH